MSDGDTTLTLEPVKVFGNGIAVYALHFGNGFNV
jgi:hypothetical protein